MDKDIFISIDPGTGKCGAAVMDASGNVREKLVFDFSGAESAIQKLLEKHCGVTAVAVGAGTGSDAVIEKLRGIPGCPASIVAVPESNTTLEARKLYEADHPRPWPLSMIPFGLFGLPEDMDAYAAIAIGLRYIEGMKEIGSR